MSKYSEQSGLVQFFEETGYFGRSAPLYGGLDGLFDYGPLGVELKRRLAQAWWRRIILERNDVEGIDGALLTQSELLDYSGHVTAFDEYLYRCFHCNMVGKDSQMEAHVCSVSAPPDIRKETKFNALFQSKIDVGRDAITCYLRPATAQQSYANFNRVLAFGKGRLPLGIAQVGKAFRNEIRPDEYPIRMREFEQMELQFFVHPNEEDRWLEYWIKERLAWWAEQGLNWSRLEVKDAPDCDRAHYSKRTVDIDYRSDQFGSFEIEGISNRSDFDLRCHHRNGAVPEVGGVAARLNEKSSETTDMANRNGQRFFASVIEPAAGLDRGVFAVLLAAYSEEITVQGRRRVLRLPRHLSPRDLTFFARDSREIEAATEIKKALLRYSDLRLPIEKTARSEAAIALEDARGTFLTAWFDVENIVLRERDCGRTQRVSFANARHMILAALFPNDYERVNYAEIV